MPIAAHKIRNTRMRRMYLSAIDSGWQARPTANGHILMTAPDGVTSLTFVPDASDLNRSAQNSEAIYRRWLRMQNAITKVSGLPPLDHHVGDTATKEPPVTYDADHIANQHDDEDHEIEGHPDAPANQIKAPITSIASEANPPIRYLCADGCGKVVLKAGGYARGHNPTSHAHAATARAAKRRTNGEPRGDGTQLFRADTRFSIEEIIEIAKFAGSESGLVEIVQLERGLNLIVRMRKHG